MLNNINGKEANIIATNEAEKLNLKYRRKKENEIEMKFKMIWRNFQK